MRPRSLLTLSAASVALAACTDRPNSEPTAPDRLRPSVSATLIPGVCNITALRENARIYFARSNDPIYKIITDLSRLPLGASATPATTDKAFDGLSRMAVVRLTNLQSSSATGAAFDALADGFLSCAESSVLMVVPGSPPLFITDVDFTNFLQNGYLFEVRGKNAGSPNPAPNDDPVGAAYQRGNAEPYWSVAPKVGSWVGMLTASSAKRFLVYGTPGAGLLENDDRITAIDLHTIPLVANGLTFSTVVGSCGVDIPGPGDPGGVRANHAGVFGSYVEPVCARGSGFGTALAQQSSFGPATLARRAIDFFAPQPLYAAMAFYAGGVGLGAEGVSPFAIYDLTDVALDSLGTIVNGLNTQPLKAVNLNALYGDTLVIKASSVTDSLPLVGVPIRMAIEGNSSSIAFFRVGAADSVTVTRTTGPDGYARFDGVVLTKAGGYTLNFRVFFDDQNVTDVVGAQVVLSNSFQIQNK